jgi:hypothetical protein
MSSATPFSSDTRKKGAGAPATPRRMRTRPSVAVAPLAISTENCLAVGGITPRKLREALAAHPDIPRSRLGHTLLVEPAHFHELLERLRVGDDEAEGLDDHDEDDDAPRTVDDVLARVGLERVAADS